MQATFSYSASQDMFSTEVADYSISLSSTPTDSNDSSGSVGDFTLTFPRPLGPDNPLNSFGEGILEGKAVHFRTEFGNMYGRVQSSEFVDQATLQVQCVSYAGGLNAYNVQARPLFTYLGSALQYYFSLGNESVNVIVSPELSSREVKYPGWNGELWYHLKLLCAAEDIQFVLTGEGYVYVEPIKQSPASTRYLTGVRVTHDSSNKAQSVKVKEYDCEPVSNGLFYPAGGWSEEVQVLSVNAGEYTEQVIELGGSIETLQPPVMQTFVSRDHMSSSVYTIVAEDGFPIQPSQWAAFGGQITFEIDDNFQSMTVKMRGARGIPLSNGNRASSYSLALASGDGVGTYSTLRIVGSGILHGDKYFTVRTGIPASETGTEVGATIDNPFLFDRARVAKAGSRVAREFSGMKISASGDSTNLSGGFALGDTGSVAFVNGRLFRVRETNYSPGGISVTAEDALSYVDVQRTNQGKTYGQVQTGNQGLTYRNVFTKKVKP